jgi:hypothetical protein
MRKAVLGQESIWAEFDSVRNRRRRIGQSPARLDPDRHCHAMALSTFQTNALCALYAEDRHISKSFCNGQFAFGGVSAALMAPLG